MVATDAQLQLHKLLSHLFLLSSIPTYIVTRYIIAAPFGRHVPKKDDKHGQYSWFGPTFNARISWAFFESPNLIWSMYYCSDRYDPLIFLLDSTKTPQQLISFEENKLQLSTNATLVLLFIMHYINRAIIYPLRMNSNSQKVPLITIFFAMLVTILNGYLQCFYLVQIEQYAPISLTLTLENMQHWTGIYLFFLGMGINIHSDGVLRNLRRYGPTGKPTQKQDEHQPHSTKHTYYIPNSPFFKYVSCPNLGGELLEWFGFALASRFSFPSVAFFVYTASNLVPRAVAHHEWYLKKFDDYPVERKWAVIPFIV